MHLLCPRMYMICTGYEYAYYAYLGISIHEQMCILIITHYAWICMNVGYYMNAFHQICICIIAHFTWMWILIIAHHARICMNARYYVNAFHQICIRMDFFKKPKFGYDYMHIWVLSSFISRFFHISEQHWWVPIWKPTT
jgi:hypothetical protein